MLRLPLMIVSSILLAACAARAEDPEPHNKRGVDFFFAGKFTEAIAEFDAEIAAQPARAPHHWQRGIALFYAKRYDDGRKQFESHKEVNPNDVENAAWHFLCAAKATSVEAARKNLIPIDLEQDTRVPMKEIFALFKGEGKPEAVLGAAARTEFPDRLKNNLCFAHLYLALYYSALGDEKLEREHIQKAAVDYKEDHYMGKVAQVHAQFMGKEKDAKK